MKSLFDLAKDEGEILGPGTDLVVSLVAVLILLLSIYSHKSEQKISELEKIVDGDSVLTEKLVDNEIVIKKLKDSILLLLNRSTKFTEYDILLRKIRESQLKIITQIAANYNTEPIEIGNNQFEIHIKTLTNQSEIIKIFNDATLQRISFGNSTLFETGDSVLRFAGKEMLYNTSIVFKEQLDLIKEIQIQGHADADQKSLKESNDNFDLAGSRAISIVRFFRDDKRLLIDPSKYVLYASSFGFYMPVERDYINKNWNLDKVRKVNEGENGNQNRRIEIVINYRELYENN